MKSGTLHFWTTGEAFTSLMLDFFRSGEFEKFEQLLGDGNLKDEQKKLAFQLRMELTGSTKDGGELSCHFLEAEPENFDETLYFAILTAIHHKSRYDNDFMDIEDLIARGDKNLITIAKYFSIEEMYKRFWKKIVREEGYEVTTIYDAITSNDITISGLLLKTGEFVRCGYQGHNELYPVLSRLNLVEGDDRLSSDALSVSSNMLTGTLGFILQQRDYDVHERYSLTDKQVDELWKLRDYDLKHYSDYGRRSKVNAELLAYISQKKGLGGKFGNLEFLKRFFPDIKTAEYSRLPNDKWETTIVRTSPKRSLPGLLNSIKATSNDEINKAIEKIIADFEIHKDVLGRNKIHWFFQEYLEGKNGVVNCIAKPKSDYPNEKTLSPEYLATLKYDINIACSTEQGSIVEGHIGNVEVGFDNETYLRRLSRELAEIFGTDIQLEFVILPNDEVRIVQLRLFQNTPNPNFNVSTSQLEDSLLIGKSFSSPEYSKNIEVNLSDILIVEQDCASELLLGKKALIVENDTNFSHILALSKALGIPSIYATGKVNLEGKTKFRFSTEYSTGFIK